MTYPGRTIRCVTVTLHVAVLLPSSVVTVITAFPSATPVITPFSSTVAIASLLLLQLIFLLVAFSGVIVAVNCFVLPVSSVVDVLSSEMSVTATSLTVTSQDAVKLPSIVVTVIVAVPSAIPLTFPSSVTVATDVSLLLQDTVLTLASSGVIVAESCTSSPIAISFVAGSITTPVTATFFSNK